MAFSDSLFLTPEQWKFYIGVSLSWILYYAFLSTVVPIPLKDKYRKLSQSDLLDVQNRFVSITHGSFVFAVCGYMYFMLPGGCNSVNTALEEKVMMISMGYFTYDFIAMAYYGLLDWAMTIHHILCAVALADNIVSGRSGSVIMAAMFVGEVSNPAMHLAYVANHLGLRHTLFFEMMEMFFMLSYMSGRLVLGTYIFYQTCLCKSASFLIKFSGFGMELQSFYMMSFMVGVLKRRFTVIAARAEKHVSLRIFQPLSAPELLKIGLDPNVHELPFI